eukprot:COSAG02_NODE_49555_length_326_cov_0.678414_1_plen_48_part_10
MCCRDHGRYIVSDATLRLSRALSTVLPALVALLFLDAHHRRAGQPHAR